MGDVYLDRLYEQLEDTYGRSVKRQYKNKRIRIFRKIIVTNQKQENNK
jgi:hypothetical protein